MYSNASQLNRVSNHMESLIAYLDTHAGYKAHAINVLLDTFRHVPLPLSWFVLVSWFLPRILLSMRHFATHSIRSKLHLNLRSFHYVYNMYQITMVNDKYILWFHFSKCSRFLDQVTWTRMCIAFNSINTTSNTKFATIPRRWICTWPGALFQSSSAWFGTTTETSVSCPFSIHFI